MARIQSVEDIKSVRPILSWVRSAKTKVELDKTAEYDSETDTYTLTTYLGDIPITYVYRNLDDEYYCCLDDGEFSVSLVQADYEKDSRLTNEYYKNSRVMQDANPMSVESNYDSDPLNPINPNVYFLNSGNNSGSLIPEVDPEPEVEYLPDCYKQQEGIEDPDDDIITDDEGDEDEDKDHDIVEAKLYIMESGELIPLLTAKDSKLMDIHNFKSVPVNKRLLDIYLRYIGFDHIYNGRLAEDSLVSKYLGENNELRLTWGNDPTNPERFTDVELGKLNDEPFNQLYDMYDQLDDNLMVAERDDVFRVESSDVIDVCKYGEVADYISLRTLVELKTEDGQLPVKYSRFRITENHTPIEAHRNEILNIDDPYLYRIIEKNYIVERVINDRDLIELSIVFKINDIKAPIKWHGMAVNYIDNPMDDPTVYFDYILNSFNKLIWHGSDVRMDGYHLTQGDLMEGSYTIGVLVEDGLMQLGKDFVIDVDQDSINIFPLNPEISEYYIKSCKRLVKNL